jgi:23S rRNA G2445 N2-methylase RlmL
MSWEDILKNDLAELKTSLERFIEPIQGKEYVDLMLETARSMGLNAYLRKMIKFYQGDIKDIKTRLSSVDNNSEEGQKLLREKNGFERHLYDLYAMKERL